MMNENKPRVILVYRNQPIKISETFIYNQSIKLKRYFAFILGSKKPKGGGIALPNDRIVYFNKGGVKGFLRETLFKVLGLIPKDIEIWIKSNNPSLIHAHFGFDGAMIMPLAKRQGIPLIVSYLGADATLKDKYIRRSFIRRRIYLLRRSSLIKNATKIIVPSKFIKNKLVDQGFPDEKISLIHHGVNLEQFSDIQVSPTFGHILYVGRLVPLKGLNFLITALSKVKEEYPSIYLTVIGDGPMRDRFEQLAKEKLVDQYEFLGFQPHDTVRDYMSKAYIFSMPSITMPSGEAETFGLVFIEAQAMGVPVVSFSSGGIPEVVEHERTGLLCEESDINSLADNISRLLGDRKLHDRMSSCAVNHVKENFDLQKQTEELERFYDTVLE